jgi:hypothetical protein
METIMTAEKRDAFLEWCEATKKARLAESIKDAKAMFANSTEHKHTDSFRYVETNFMGREICFGR